MLPLLKQLIAGFTWFFTVAPWEQAIRVRLGNRVQVLRAGFYIRIPFVDRVFKQSIRRRLMVVRAQTLTTRDGRVVTISGAIGYAISDLRKLYDTLEAAADTIENEAAAAVARFIGSHDYAECNAVAVEKFVCQSIDFTRYGLHGEEFRVTSFATAKTYRLIMGDLPSWNHSEQLKMGEDQK